MGLGDSQSAPQVPTHTGHSKDAIPTGLGPNDRVPESPGLRDLVPSDTAHRENEKPDVTNVFESSDKFRGPAAKGFDWDHIVNRHAPWGEIAEQRLKDRPGYLKSLYEGMMEKEIKALVERAWKIESGTKCKILILENKEELSTVVMTLKPDTQ